MLSQGFPSRLVARRGPAAARRYLTTQTQPNTSPFAPRHLLSIADLTSLELSQLVGNAFLHKQAWKSGSPPPHLTSSLVGRSVALVFSKRSSRTRISTEAAVAAMGGHPMFLSANDIQLGVNESLRDTAIMTSSMVSSIVARVKAHSEVADLAKWSSVPIINALSDSFHPLQTIADYLTIFEAFHGQSQAPDPSRGLGLDGLKIAWVGDANNVLFDLAIGAMKLGVEVAVATPSGYEIPAEMRALITSVNAGGNLSETQVPEEAVKNADIIVTDTWVSMGQEEESAKRLRDFAGFEVTTELAERGGAKPDWKFMHCLPRHPEEVEDAVFYGPRSLVFPEAENRLWAALSVIEGFVVRKGKIN